MSESNDFEPLISHVHFVGEFGDEFQGLFEVVIADASAAVNQNHSVQFGRKTFFSNRITA